VFVQQLASRSGGALHGRSSEQLSQLESRLRVLLRVGIWSERKAGLDWRVDEAKLGEE